ncbi:LysM peptidoglycan-binding domain-containing protein [Fictibacillus phosphorivorans]|uniref:LysM peptidoglycan-binding domain-containing protein n=1 Tax=Fictibacillus phosphorivorans TaxID=1221500 RepID=UPI00203F5772|nr:LysM peptidoglycan-binding domain-containing protein [Fictibacillus phosphorivorans]MCM3718885.1 LysM peptidoglycan-binding domain-containing protein [Fictibacillus phosphorivorans]MCM3776507.1 LysM peptidoglycan-binding domain-containing protein [Fictibacillus phosphorivorans]
MRLKIAALSLSAFLLMGSATYAATPYVVKHNDTLWSIAQDKNVSMKSVIGMNLLKSSSIYAGQTLYVPTSSKQYTVKTGDTLYKIASASNVSLWAIKQANPQVRQINWVYPGQVLDLPASAVQKSAAPASAPSSVGAYATQVSQLVNQERQKAGLAPLTLDAELCNVALVKAKDMIAHNYFDHNSPTYGSPFDMMRNFGIDYTAAGENIAKGQTSAQAVMNDWMNSPGHRQNILSSNYDLIGVAYYEGAWVQLFKK